jgi:hypothetical protein
MNEETDQFERRLIERAESGNAEAGRAVLQQIISAITAGRFDSPVLPFLAKCLSMFLHDGVGLERALCVEDEPSKGGARRKYDTIELAAVDILLRRHRQFSSEDAIKWTAENIGADRKTVHRARNESGNLKSG